ncbi:MAG: hypothetical protein ABSF09_09660 [Candidatus Bathyarchaeia archaeon]
MRSAEAAIGDTKDLKPHDHVSLFYSDPKLKQQLLFEYLKAGYKREKVKG